MSREKKWKKRQAPLKKQQQAAYSSLLIRLKYEQKLKRSDKLRRLALKCTIILIHPVYKIFVPEIEMYVINLHDAFFKVLLWFFFKFATLIVNNKSYKGGRQINQCRPSYNYLAAANYLSGGRQKLIIWRPPLIYLAATT